MHSFNIKKRKPLKQCTEALTSELYLKYPTLSIFVWQIKAKKAQIPEYEEHNLTETDLSELEMHRNIANIQTLQLNTKHYS